MRSFRAIPYRCVAIYRELVDPRSSPWWQKILGIHQVTFIQRNPDIIERYDDMRLPCVIPWTSHAEVLQERVVSRGFGAGT